MVDTDDTRRTIDDGRRTTPRVWHKLPTGELKTTKPILKNKKYELVHPFKCRIAKLAESVFKILDFTFLH